MFHPKTLGRALSFWNQDFCVPKVMSCIPMVQAGGFNGRFLQSYVLDTTPAIMHQDDTTFFSRESWIKHLLFATGILGLGGGQNPRYVRKYAQDLFPHKAGMSCTKSSRTWGVDFFCVRFWPPKNRPVIFALWHGFCGEIWGCVFQICQNRSHKVFAIRPFRWFSWLISLNKQWFRV